MRYFTSEFLIERNKDRCINCGACARQCANEAHYIDPDTGEVHSDETKCVDCQRCVCLCPTNALAIIKNPNQTRDNANWTQQAIREVEMQALTGGILLSGMGNPKPYPVYWDKILLNASLVTNPSIDPLREPMETKTYLGAKPTQLEFDEEGNITTELPPMVELDTPLMMSAMSFGSISLNAQKSLAMAAKECNTFFNTGEGGLHMELYPYADHAIVQVASVVSV